MRWQGVSVVQHPGAPTHRGNDWQGLLGVGLHQNLGEHARHQPTLRVAQHNSRPLRATSHVDLGKQRLDLSGKALCRPGTDRGLH